MPSAAVVEGLAAGNSKLRRGLQRMEKGRKWHFHKRSNLQLYTNHLILRVSSDNFVRMTYPGTAKLSRTCKTSLFCTFHSIHHPELIRWIVSKIVCQTSIANSSANTPASGDSALKEGQRRQSIPRTDRGWLTTCSRCHMPLNGWS